MEAMLAHCGQCAELEACPCGCGWGWCSAQGDFVREGDPVSAPDGCGWFREDEGTWADDEMERRRDFALEGWY